MALAPHSIDHISAHMDKWGHPAEPLKPQRRTELLRSGLEVPARPALITITPPLPGARSGVGGCCYDGTDTPGPYGHCHVCGAHTELDQSLSAHAVAGFEETLALDGSGLHRFLVTHCREHAGINHDACRRDRQTPGSGIESASGGYCEPLSKILDTNMVFLPGGRHLLRWLKWMAIAAGVAELARLAVSVSQGQQTAMFAGPVANLLYPGDATSGHGLNAGLLRVLSGSAPSTAPAANQAETGTLGINWSFAATAMASNSLSGTAMVLTATAISNVNASASITAGYARAVMNGDGAGTSTTDRRLQFAVGTSGSDMNFNTLAISSGGACSVTSLTITFGTAA